MVFDSIARYECPMKNVMRCIQKKRWERMRAEVEKKKRKTLNARDLAHCSPKTFAYVQKESTLEHNYKQFAFVWFGASQESHSLRNFYFIALYYKLIWIFLNLITMILPVPKKNQLSPSLSLTLSCSVPRWNVYKTRKRIGSKTNDWTHYNCERAESSSLFIVLHISIYIHFLIIFMNISFWQRKKKYDCLRWRRRMYNSDTLRG